MYAKQLRSSIKNKCRYYRYPLNLRGIFLLFYYIEVYSIDQGALGGSTRVDLAKKYCYIFKKNQRIYLGDYGEDRDVRWIDSNHVQIESKIINISLR